MRLLILSRLWDNDESSSTNSFEARAQMPHCDESLNLPQKFNHISRQRPSLREQSAAAAEQLLPPDSKIVQPRDL